MVAVTTAWIIVAWSVVSRGADLLLAGPDPLGVELTAELPATALLRPALVLPLSDGPVVESILL